MTHVNLFISYAHEDSRLCKDLLKHMSQLRRNGLEGWYDRKITAGSEWAGAIGEHLNTADIILLLISKDFLASDYCYDVEMKRALERHEHGEAHVVPVILKPCDWKSSPFGNLEALPKNGKPVVDWKTSDHGLLNVVEALCHVIENLARENKPQPGPSAAKAPVFKALPRSREWLWITVGSAAVLLVSAGWLWWAVQQRYIAEGDAYLDIGRYSDARLPYLHALKWNPFSKGASRGLDVVQLSDLRANIVAFERKLSKLSGRFSRSGHFRVLKGDFLFAQGQFDSALTEYQEAVRVNPGLAEGFYRLGVLLAMRRDSKRSLDAYKEAVHLAPGSPHYRNNLADALFRSGEYDNAISQFAQIDRFPSATLEMANILRLLGQLDDAAEKERLAVEWLENDSVMGTAENKFPWMLDLGDNQRVSIPSRSQKLCYGRWELSATLYLNGDPTQARESATRAAQACGNQSLDIKAVVRRELERLSDEQDTLVPRIKSYREDLFDRQRPLKPQNTRR